MAKNKMHAVEKSTKADMLIEDLQIQLEAATREQGNKLLSAKSHLVSQLGNVSQKYLTVNGYMQARTTIDQVLFGASVPEEADLNADARNLARYMSELSSSLGDRIEDTPVADINGEFMDTLLDTNFVNKFNTVNDTAKQLLVVNLLQNIGPSVDDIVGFRERTDDEIAKIQAELDAAMPEAQKEA